MSITYTPVSEKATWTSDDSDGYTIETPSKLALLKQVSNTTNLLGAGILCNGGRQAIHRALVTLKAHGCSEARYFNVTGEHDSLNVMVADAEGRLPWGYVIENGCFVSNADGKVWTESRTVSLKNIDTSMALPLV